MDRFFRGFIAGIIGGIPMNIWSMISFHLFKFSKLRFADWGAFMALGHLPDDTLQLVIGLIAQMIFVGCLGVIFAYLIPQITSRGYQIKGMIYGFIVGFIIYSIPVLFQIPRLKLLTTETALSNIIGGVLWGGITALALKALDTSLREAVKKR